MFQFFTLLLLSILGFAESGLAAPKVVTSILPVHSLAAAVMEGAGKPRLLVRGAASPHAYAMRPSDARALAGADLIFWIGPELEGFLAKPLAALARAPPSGGAWRSGMMTAMAPKAAAERKMAPTLRGSLI